MLEDKISHLPQTHRYFSPKLNESAAPKTYLHCQTLAQFPLPDADSQTSDKRSLKCLFNWQLRKEHSGRTKPTATLGEKGTIFRAPQRLERAPSCLYCFPAFLPQTQALCSRLGAEYQCTARRTGLRFSVWFQKTKASALQHVPAA